MSRNGKLMPTSDVKTALPCEISRRAWVGTHAFMQEQERMKKCMGRDPWILLKMQKMSKSGLKNDAILDLTACYNIYQYWHIQNYTPAFFV